MVHNQPLVVSPLNSRVASHQVVVFGAETNLKKMIFLGKDQGSTRLSSLYKCHTS